MLSFFHRTPLGQRRGGIAPEGQITRMSKADHLHLDSGQSVGVGCVRAGVSMARQPLKGYTPITPHQHAPCVEPGGGHALARVDVSPILPHTLPGGSPDLCVGRAPQTLFS